MNAEIASEQPALPPAASPPSCAPGFSALLYWDDQALAAVAAKVAQACHDWSGEWACAAIASASYGDLPRAARYTSPRQAPALMAFPLHAPSRAGGQAAHAWLACAACEGDGEVPQPAQLVGRQVFGDTVNADGGSIAAELSQAALDHLVRAIRGVLGIGADADPVFDVQALATNLPETEFGEWSGGVRVELPWSGAMVLYLNGHAVAAMAPPKRIASAQPKTSLTALSLAARDSRVGVQARLHAVEFTLGHLKSLQVGDVVVLPHALDEPLQVVSAAGTVIGQAYLGRTGAHRALEVLPPAAAASAA